MRKVLILRVDMTDLSPQEREDLECALVAQLEGIRVSETVEVCDEEEF